MEIPVKVRKMIYSKQTDKNNTVLVYIEQLQYDSNLKKKCKRISTNVRVNPKNWSTKKQKVLKDEEDYEKKNLIIHNCFLSNLQPIAEVKSIKYVIQYFDEYIVIRKSHDDPTGTVKEFKTCQNRIKEFEKCIGKKHQFKDIDMAFSIEFSVWMHSIVLTPVFLDRFFQKV